MGEEPHDHLLLLRVGGAHHDERWRLTLHPTTSPVNGPCVKAPRPEDTGQSPAASDDLQDEGFVNVGCQTGAGTLKGPLVRISLANGTHAIVASCVGTGITGHWQAGPVGGHAAHLKIGISCEKQVNQKAVLRQAQLVQVCHQTSNRRDHERHRGDHGEHQDQRQHGRDEQGEEGRDEVHQHPLRGERPARPMTKMAVKEWTKKHQPSEVRAVGLMTTSAVIT